MQPILFRLPFRLPLIGNEISGWGFMVLLAILSGVYLSMRRAMKAKGDPDLVLNCGFIALIGGIGGSRLFYVIHYWNTVFAHQENRLAAILNLRSGGMEFYGGFLTVTVCLFGYLAWRRVSIRMYLDLVAPSLFLGLAIGRLGCFLNGCCWGGVCVTETGEKAIPWAVQFPFGSPVHSQHWLESRVTVPGQLLSVGRLGNSRPLPKDCMVVSPEQLLGPERAYELAAEMLDDAKRTGADEKTVAKLERGLKRAKRYRDRAARKYKPLTELCERFDLNPSDVQSLAGQLSSRSLPVHPAQVYSSIAALLMAVSLSLLFRVRKRHGVVAGVGLLLYPIQRFVLELVRTDNPRDMLGFSVSQALSVGILAAGIIFLVVVYVLPERSPRAVAFVPPAEDGE